MAINVEAGPGAFEHEVVGPGDLSAKSGHGITNGQMDTPIEFNNRTNAEIQMGHALAYA